MVHCYRTVVRWFIENVFIVINRLFIVRGQTVYFETVHCETIAGSFIGDQWLILKGRAFIVRGFHCKKKDDSL